MYILQLISYVNLGKVLKSPGPKFPNLYNGDGDNFFLWVVEIKMRLHTAKPFKTHKG